ncbi:hypothetical protein GALMADRAFT_558323 [Galerina marginata CBS 339.88]|uniref:Uncharacterized protein n=1 Tax=Galerina marginata (strain CBS 339.88) TaxID=685588 RepID=A0A067SX10_GALM3|nr:hypothetical protein GALMADRAFT_558323 [Galerina marginata CBS 339.88]
MDALLTIWMYRQTCDKNRFSITLSLLTMILLSFFLSPHFLVSRNDLLANTNIIM